MAYDRYAVELTDKDGQIYGVMDAEAREEVGELNSAITNIGGLEKTNVNDISEWEIGTIGTNGQNDASTTRIRTVEGIPLEGYNLLDVSIDSGYKWLIYWYDENNAVVTDDITWGKNFRSDNITGWAIPSGAVKARFLVADANSGTASLDYSEHITAKLYPRVSTAEELIDEVRGTAETVSPTLIDGLNFASNATKYSVNGNYETYYVPIVAGRKYKVSFVNTDSSSQEVRMAYCTAIPANTVSGTFIKPITAGAKQTDFGEYTANTDGYLSVSTYKTGHYSLVFSETSGGIEQRIYAVEASTEQNQEDVEALETFVHGEPESVAATKVSGLNFAENAIKYTSSGAYETWYIPVAVGNEYVFRFDNADANVNEVRFAYSAEIPAANVAGAYLSKLTIPQHSTGEKTVVADKTGYLGVAWYSHVARTLTSVSEISGGLVQRINVNDAKSAEITVVENAIEDINDELTEMKGQTIQLESGTYWGATTVGTSVESQIQTSTSSTLKRTTLTLPANKVLRIMGVGATDLTRLYWVFSAETGILIDIADATDQLAPRGYYLRYNEDTHIYINCANAYDHFIGIVDDISPWVDISKCIGQTTRKIIDFGERDIRYAVRNMKRKSRNGSSYAPALFLHFSDIHGDAENLTRLMEFASDKHISNYLSDILCTGDVVKSTIDDGMTWFDAISGTNKILLLPGNHDSVKGTASSPTTASKQEMYETLFEGRVSNWNVTQPSEAATAYKGYYYKDYSAAKLRLICLDANGSGDYQTAEVAWFADALEGAYNLGYSVLCAEHFMFDKSVCTGVKCTFQSDEAPENEGSWVIPAAYASAVETFIGYGGDFVCWLGGHVHKDRLWLHNNEHQLCIGVTTASHETHQISYEDSERIAGDKSQDAFNIIGIDTFAKRITILKIGSDLTRMLAHKRYLCIDYENKTVLFND